MPSARKIQRSTAQIAAINETATVVKQTLADAIAACLAGDVAVGNSVEWREREADSGRGGNTGRLMQAVTPENRPTENHGKIIWVGDGDLYLDGLFKDGLYTVDRFGAASSDETVALSAIQACIDYLSENGGVALFTDDKTYNINNFIITRPNVSLGTIGNGIARIKSSTEIGGGYGDVFLLGNFHPDFTEDFTYYPAVTPSGATRTLTVTGEGTRFNVGDQVFIASTEKGSSGGFEVPLYGWLNIVESVTGDSVTFREVIDVAVPVEVAILKNEVCRGGIPAFFYADASIKNLEITTVGGWISDSASLNASFENLIVRGTRGVYGNAWQRARFNNSKFFTSHNMLETSHNSLNSKIDGCEFNYIGDNQAVDNGFSVQEFARNITVSNFQVNSKTLANGQPLVRTINAKNVKFLDGEVHHGGSNSVSIVQLGNNSVTYANFKSDNNKVVNTEFHLDECARYAYLFARPDSSGNGLINCDFYGSASVEAVSINSAAGAEGSVVNIRQCHFENGDISFSGGTECSYEVVDCYIANGFVAERSNDFAFLRRGKVINNTSGATRERQKFISSVGNTSAQNATIGTMPISGPTIIYDTYKFAGRLRSQGNNRDRVIRVVLMNITDDTESIAAEFTALAAEHSTNFVLNIEFQPRALGAVLSASFSKGDGTAYTVKNHRDSGFSTAKDYAIRIDSQIGTGAGDEGNASWQIFDMRSWIESLIYKY